MTIKSYSEAVRQLDAFLSDRGMPRAVAAIHRKHIEAFIEDQLARLRPVSAANRYRSVQQFFKWLVSEGELRESPMVRMRPPTIPETPPPILREVDTDALFKVTAGTSFEERRDRALIRLLLDTGIRRAELAGLRSRISTSIRRRSTYSARAGGHERFRSTIRQRESSIGT